MNETLQAVLDYIQAPQTDYAFLITGPWGCGKTYFWKNAIEPKLKQLKCEGSSWRPLYASLYGCQKLEDIDTQLFFAAYPHLRNKWTSRLSTVGGHALKQLVKIFTRFELPAIDLKWLVNTKNAVLCFDDLERTQLSIKEALGYINNYVEHEGVKVVILCSEENINGEDNGIYKKMKEKVVGTTRTFRPNLDTVFTTLIEEHKQRTTFYNFIFQNEKLLRHLFDRSETHNIRTLRRVIAALAVIFESLPSNNINVNLLAKQLFYVVVPAACELYGHGADPDKIKKILGMEYLSIVAGLSYFSKDKADKTKEESFEEQFNERYLKGLGLTELAELSGCLPICEYLVTGFLDKKALTEWAEELIRTPDEKEQRIKRLLANPREMEDEEFEQTTSQVLREVEAGEIEGIGAYINLYNTFEWLAENNLVLLTKQQVLDKFKQGLGQALNAGRIMPDSHLKFEINHYMQAPVTVESKAMREYILGINENSLRQKESERIKSLASRFDRDDIEFIDALVDRGNSGLVFMPVFQELNADDIAKRILELPNHLKYRFGIIINERYLKHQIESGYAVELPVLAKIRDVMQKHCKDSDVNKQPMPMSLVLETEIVHMLDRVVDRLQQLEQKKAEPAPESNKDHLPPENDSNESDDKDEADDDQE